MTAARSRGTFEEGEADTLAMGCSSAAEALDLALDLRRWSVHGRCGSRSIRIGVAARHARSPLRATLARAKRLACSVDPGSIGVERALQPLAERRHVLLDPEDGHGSPRLTWSPGGQTDDPVPPPVALALDRPWPMIGRRLHLVELGEAWARTVDGGSGGVLIAGEPGIGKTRLLGEALAEVLTGGGTIAMGAESDMNPSPFGSVGEALSQLGTLRPELTRATTVARALEQLSPSSPGPLSGHSGGLGDERAVVFDLIAAAFEHVCSSQPTFLALEDLHVGDSSSLALLSFLLQRAIPRLLIVATYRSTEIEASGQQEQLLARIRSAVGVKHLTLGGLPVDQLADLAGSFGVSVPEHEAKTIAARLNDETGGNPLYASELLRSASEFGGQLTAEPIDHAIDSLAVLIQERARAMGEPAYTYLRAAALVGRRFAPELVADALAIDRRDLDPSLLRAQRAGLVLRADNGEYEFSHALTARCLVDTFGSQEAGRLHRSLAESIESTPGSVTPARVASLATHWSLALPRDPGRAVHYFQLAGEQALDSLDHELAAGWFERGLELHAELADGDPRQRCNLMLGLGGALRYRGADFRDSLLEAGRLAAELEDDERLVAAAIANTRGFVSHAGYFDRQRTALLELALDRLGQEQRPESALILAQLALELTFTGEDARRKRLADQALGLARAAGDERLLARVLIRRLIALWGPNTLDERIAAATESAEIATRLDEPLDLFHGLHWRGMASIETGRVAEAAADLDESSRIARRLGDRTALWLAEFGSTCLLMLRGDLAAAESGANRGLALGQEGNQPDALPFYASQIAAVRWHQGRLGELAPLLAQTLEENPGIQGLRSLVVLALAVSGEHERAISELRVDASTGFEEVPMDPIWLPVMATYGHAVAELAAAGSDELRAAASDLDALMGPFEHQLASTTVSIWGSGSHILGRLAAVRGERLLAIERLEAAIAFYERLGAPVWRGLACRHLAEIEIQDRSSREAVAKAERLRGEALRLGLELDAGELLRASGQAPSDTHVLEHLTAQAPHLGLSERQAEVARLAAAGLSNAAIGEQLHISPHTVKHHLQTAYKQLGVRGRAELARRFVESAS